MSKECSNEASSNSLEDRADLEIKKSPKEEKIATKILVSDGTCADLKLTGYNVMDGSKLEGGENINRSFYSIEQ